ncbi:MAG: hypothetical protein H7A33_05020 [Deltaproteobacteria bacterium]|nr:hypothetical protein [Deltaproteobacteria bacterium]
MKQNMISMMLRLAIPLLALGSYACNTALESATQDSSSTSTSSGSSPQLTSISELPLATDEVQSSSNSSYLRGHRDSREGENCLHFDSQEEQNFDADVSVAACETYNMSRQALAGAALGDLILCRTQVAADQATEQGVDLYDGEYHVLAINHERGDGSSEQHKVRVRVTQGENNTISEFEVAACDEDGDQEMYSQQSLDGNAYSLVSKHVRSRHGEDGMNSLSVTGTLDENGNFVGEKNINLEYDVSDREHGDDLVSSWGRFDFTQGATQASLSGQESGSVVSDLGDSTFENKIAGFIEVSVDASASEFDLRNFALGDGHVFGLWSGVGEGQNSWDIRFEEAWEGETLTSIALADSIFADAILDTTLPDGVEPNLGFTAEESYDCSDEAEVTITITRNSAEDERCEQYELEERWVDCLEAVNANISTMEDEDDDSLFEDEDDDHDEFENEDEDEDEDQDEDEDEEGGDEDDD